MILIASNSAREADLLVNLCEQKHWSAYGCTSVREFVPLLEKNQPHVVMIRDRFEDGYSDDILAEVRNITTFQRPYIIVLMGPERKASKDARQVALGADCILHDPLPLEILFTYLSKYRTRAPSSPPKEEASISFSLGDVTVFPQEHRISRRNKTVHVAPQEVALLRLFVRRPGTVIPYPVLYHDLFGRRFSGDTTNCRVLLGKVAASFRELRVNLRTFIEVIPKSGYRYRAEGGIASRARDCVGIANVSKRAKRTTNQSFDR